MKKEVTIGAIEGRFAEMIWEKAPITSSELVKLAQKELNWKRTTVHTVIRKLCDKGLFQRDENGMVTVLVSKDEFYARQSRQLVDTGYNGSLPLFVAGFVNNQKLTHDEIDEIIALLKNSKSRD
ncbi:MAG: BlaI/MecI/CopY family transcriptional regulator [Lachnospiraceae bacterium]|nr:BlaI/MecI/CopY family transcriptional regulator [Lachnospiraceae bacterium]